MKEHAADVDFAWERRVPCVSVSCAFRALSFLRSEDINIRIKE